MTSLTSKQFARNLSDIEWQVIEGAANNIKSIASTLVLIQKNIEQNTDEYHALDGAIRLADLQEKELNSLTNH